MQKDYNRILTKHFKTVGKRFLATDYTHPRYTASFLFRFQIKMAEEIHRSLEADEEYRNYLCDKIYYKYFIPMNYRDIPEYCYPLIAVITEYFECKAFWVNHFTKNQVEPIKAIKMIGYVHNVVLCSAFLSNVINTIQSLQFYRTEYLIKKNKNKRKRNRYHHLDHIKYKRTDSRVMAKKYTMKFTERVFNVWLRRLQRKQYSPHYFHKVDEIYSKLRKDGELKFRPNKRGVTSITKAACRKNRFQDRKLIELY